MINLGAEYIYNGKLYKTIAFVRMKTESGWKDGVYFIPLYPNEYTGFTRTIEDFKTYFKLNDGE